MNAEQQFIKALQKTQARGIATAAQSFMISGGTDIQTITNSQSITGGSIASELVDILSVDALMVRRSNPPVAALVVGTKAKSAIPALTSLWTVYAIATISNPPFTRVIRLRNEGVVNATNYEDPTTGIHYYSVPFGSIPLGYWVQNTASNQLTLYKKIG